MTSARFVQAASEHFRSLKHRLLASATFRTAWRCGGNILVLKGTLTAFGRWKKAARLNPRSAAS